MARINRTDVIQKAVNDLALNVSVDKIPNEILDKVQLVYGLNKHFSNFSAFTNSTSSGALALTLPTIGAGQEIYVTAINAGLIKDSTCDIATGTVSVTLTPDASGILTTVLRIPILTLTAQSENLTISLPYPLKIKANTTANFSTTFTAGTLSRSFGLIGFTTSSN